MMYHGDPKERQNLLKTKLLRNIKGGKPNERFPVVCTSYEMVVRDSPSLSKINWENIIIVRPNLPQQILIVTHTESATG